jgi:tRNA (cytosine49-C5)-methyltransferase
MSIKSDNLVFKPEFIERYSKLTDFEAFKKCCMEYLRRGIRVNTLKISVDEIKKRLEDEWVLISVPWCNEGFWIEHKGDDSGKKRRDVGNLIEHALGYIYIQEPASMIPPIVLDPKPGDIVLDMCASPGSKTSQMCAMMNNEGLIVANDYKGARLAPLGLNLQRVGSKNSIITLMEGRFFRDIKFDKILVDAPCSGTGTIRKSQKIVDVWKPYMIRRLAGTQKILLDTAYNCLKSGGVMVYSTCSNEPEENEAIVTNFLESHDDCELLEINIPIKRSLSIEEFEGNKYHKDIQKALRIWPQDNDTEGFFVAKIKKK